MSRCADPQCLNCEAWKILSELVEGADMVTPSPNALDEAFIWEPPFERRPLITFGLIRRARMLLALAASTGGEA